MAPEVIARRAFDPFVADIWSLGITFFWMARGCSPFPLRDTTALLKETQCGLPSTANGGGQIPQGFFRLLRQMIEPRPELRISVQDVTVQLAGMIELTKGRKNQVEHVRSISCGQPLYLSHWATQRRLSRGLACAGYHPSSMDLP
jgi:serine/threonine protein kinase